MCESTCLVAASGMKGDETKGASVVVLAVALFTNSCENVLELRNLSCAA